MSWLVEFRQNGNQNIALILGSGVVGTSIFRELHFQHGFDFVPVNLEWGNSMRPIQKDLKSLISSLITNWNHSKGLDHHKTSYFDVVWAAGKTGFYSTEHNTKLEKADFKCFLEFTQSMAHLFPNTCPGFHLMSSIGGLFENQGLVSTNTEPRPLRPYGRLKLSQENLLRKSCPAVKPSIYRLSSVYGYIRQHQRAGLVSVLVQNAVLSRPTTINGSFNTLRDFVWASDVARFIVNKISQKQNQQEITTLATGKPESIGNVQRLVESRVRYKTYVKYSLRPSNSGNMCVSVSALPKDWRPTPLTTNISLVLADFLHRRTIHRTTIDDHLKLTEPKTKIC